MDSLVDEAQKDMAIDSRSSVGRDELRDSHVGVGPGEEAGRRE
jgi:hypothetical protein